MLLALNSTDLENGNVSGYHVLVGKKKKNSKEYLIP